MCGIKSDKNHHRQMGEDKTSHYCCPRCRHHTFVQIERLKFALFGFFWVFVCLFEYRMPCPAPAHSPETHLLDFPAALLLCWCCASRTEGLGQLDPLLTSPLPSVTSIASHSLREYIYRHSLAVWPISQECLWLFVPVIHAPFLESQVSVTPSYIFSDTAKPSS